jgi:peptidyl-prolyl cis-trans isomerase D
MFDAIRTHRNWLMPILFLIMLLFVFSGVYDFQRLSGRDADAVAKVDGQAISQQDLEVAHRNRVESMMQRLGKNADARLFDTPQMRAATLDNLITEKALSIEAAHLRLDVPDSLIRDKIAEVPAFQVNGKFDYDTYKTLLTENGYTEASFEARVRADISRQALQNGVAVGAMVPHAVIDRLQVLERERRQIRRLVFKSDDYLAKADITDAAIKADYDANKGEYKIPESAKAQYVVLSLDDIASRLPVDAAAVRKYYDENQSRWSEAEQRHANHILITSGPDGSAPTKEAARAMAQDLLKQVRANPALFAKLAKDKSRDPGSAAQGGDLGWFGRGAMTKPFEEAVFALTKGQISDVVETSFGFHLIQLVDIKGGKAKPFDEVRPQIEADVRKQSAQKAYAEAAEQFTNLVYEQSDSLTGVADKFKLPVQTAEHLARAVAPSDKARIFTPAVLEATFAVDSVEKHHNTKAIDVGGNTLVAVHVTAYTPSATPPLDVLKPSIKTKLEHAAAVELAHKAGETRLADLKKAADDKGFEAQRDLGRRDGQVLPESLINTIMSLAADKLPTYVGAELPDGNYAVVHVLAASMADAPDPKLVEERLSALTQRAASSDEGAYVSALRDRLGAKVTRPDLAAPARGASPRPAN